MEENEKRKLNLHEQIKRRKKKKEKKEEKRKKESVTFMT